MNERTLRKEMMVLNNRLLFPSFQADFYQHGEDEIAKVYKHDDIWNGMIPLGDDQKRAALICREVICLRGLASPLQARIKTVEVPTTNSPYKRPDTAIVMAKIPKDAFLEDRIYGTNPIDRQIFAAIARRVADFHFDVTACPRAEVPSMTQYLQELMAGETELLLDGANADERKIYNRWGGQVAAYIQKHSPLLERRRELLDEPIVGHGDIKASNIVNLPSGEVCIIDPAPVDIWQINDRRMDAGFFKTELQLLGREQEAAAYWQAYDESYNAKLLEKQLNPEELATLKQSNGIMDRISDIYRLTIFHRLAVKKGVNPQCGPVSKQQLEEIYFQI